MSDTITGSLTVDVLAIIGFGVAALVMIVIEWRRYRHEMAAIERHEAEYLAQRAPGFAGWDFDEEAA